MGKVERYLASLTGSHRPILEYLVSDVFSVLPEAVQEFLLQTSVLSRLTGALCDKVTGRDDSAQLLEQLERDNLFLVSLDASQNWYRFHPLFAEAMQHLAQQRLGESRLCELLHEASSWYEEHEMLVEAVEASLTAQDFSQAAELMERAIPPQFVNPEYHTLRRWLEQLPNEVLQRHPTLSFTYAVAILYTSDRRAPTTIARLQTPLEIAEQHWRVEGSRSKLAQVLIFRTMVAWFQGAPPHELVGARQALDMLPEEDIFWRSVSLIGVGLEELLAGKMNAARQTLIEALALAQPEGYQRIFLDEGDPLASLLRETLPEIRVESLAAYARALLYTKAQEQARQEGSTNGSPDLLVEPLSGQEKRVLRLLAAGLSTPEIARELVISANTVKTHVKNIYSKLGVNNREQVR